MTEFTRFLCLRSRNVRPLDVEPGALSGDIAMINVTKRKAYVQPRSRSVSERTVDSLNSASTDDQGQNLISNRQITYLFTLRCCDRG